MDQGTLRSLPREAVRETVAEVKATCGKTSCGMLSRQGNALKPRGGRSCRFASGGAGGTCPGFSTWLSWGGGWWRR